MHYYHELLRLEMHMRTTHPLPWNNGATLLQPKPRRAHMTTQNTTAQQTTLILGGTGKTGSRIAKRLAERGGTTRVASRSSAIRFDWEDRRSWSAALHGADAVYVAYYPDLAFPRATEHVPELARVAVDSGVRRIVLLSGRGEPQVYPSEDAVRDSGAAYTILRCAWFAQNFSEGHLRDQVLSGELALPAGDTAEPFVDLDDVADVAVEALTDPKHAGKTYELSGPRLVTFAQACREIAEASGHEVRYVPVSLESYREFLATVMPADVATFLSDLFAQILDGHNAHVDGDIERVLGRAPRDFAAFAQKAAAAGMWSR
jgi:uncharacterized protein YbjT (DUF2867 family)